MIKKLLITAFLGLTLFANPLTTGQSLPTLKIKDQFEKEFTIDSNIKTIIFSASKTEGTTIKEFLLTKDKDYLTTNKAVYVADITGMPSIITSLVAMPKMKAYPFSVLLVDDSNKGLFPVKEDMISIISLDSGKITDVKYVKTAEELGQIFK
jgi:predicted transcriptional regulator